MDNNSILQKLDGLEARFEEVSTLIILKRASKAFDEIIIIKLSASGKRLHYHITMT